MSDKPADGEPFLDADGAEIEGATLNADGTVTLELEQPVRVMSETRSSLTFRRPTGKEFRRLDQIKGAASASMAMLAILANVPATAIDELDGADVYAANKIIAVFTKKSPRTGAGS